MVFFFLFENAVIMSIFGKHQGKYVSIFGKGEQNFLLFFGYKNAKTLD